MGRDKATLPFGSEVLLQRVTRVLREWVAPIFVVAAADQDLPELPPDVSIVRDEFTGLGPMAGLAAGLAAIRETADAAFVTSCDAPFLARDFVKSLIDALGDHDLAIPRDARFFYPLAAVYATRLAPTARALVTQRQLRVGSLAQRVRTREVDVADLRTSDPDLLSLVNINSPEEYLAALERAGYAISSDGA